MEKDRALNLLQNGLLPQVHGAYYDALKMVIDGWQTEQKVGRWIKRNNPDLGICMQELKMCSVCGRMFCARYNPYWSYCGNCGAKMEEGE